MKNPGFESPCRREKVAYPVTEVFALFRKEKDSS
jgi:hypothetical protein